MGFPCGDNPAQCDIPPMPELPEVEFATRRAARVLRGRRVLHLRALHPAQRRHLPAHTISRIAGHRIVDVVRRGKAQLITLDDGATLLVHFRMAGDWATDRSSAALPPHARVVFELDTGRRLVLVDPRALSAVTYHPPDAPPRLSLGPDAEDPTVTSAVLHQRFARTRGSIKAALLNQCILAGVGNIYAAEACWHARISPRAQAASLSRTRCAHLLDGIRTALADGHRNAGRYHRGERLTPFRVYDREGAPCPRCHTTIRRIVQSGRSTYFCPTCQAR
jgi:formamidopyrimidine-DNA glycosylase